MTNRLFAVCGVLLVLASPATAGTVGYVGMSTLSRVAVGVTQQYPDVDAWDGLVLTQLNGGGYDGCDTKKWLDSSSHCWTNYLQMLSLYPETDRIVMMVGFKPGREQDVENIRMLTDLVRDACSVTCEVILLGLPDFVETCNDMPTNGIPALSRLQAHRAALTSLGQPRDGVIPGPQLSTIGSTDVNDGCHQNQNKRREHALQLLPWIR